MYDIYYEVDNILPVDNERGRVDITFRIRQKGTFRNEAVFTTMTFFSSNDKTITEIIAEAVTEAQKFADILAKAEVFLTEE